MGVLVFIPPREVNAVIELSIDVGFWWFVCLFFTILYYIVKLFEELFGSKVPDCFNTKVIVVFLGLALLPCIVVLRLGGGDYIIFIALSYFQRTDSFQSGLEVGM
jgi:hypothetical protein